MKKIIITLLLSILFIPNIYASEKELVTFNECVDGDTAYFNYNKEKIKVRFLAIDTPETKHPTKGIEPYGKEASEYTCNSLKRAKNIYLEFDDNSDKIDKYNRYLAWIWIDDKLLQEEIISLGYAKIAYLYNDYKYTEQLQQVQEKAQVKKVGIWSDEEYISANKEETIEESEPMSEREKELQQKIESFVNKHKTLLSIIVISVIVIICLLSNKLRKKILKQIKNKLK